MAVTPVWHYFCSLLLQLYMWHTICSGFSNIFIHVASLELWGNFWQSAEFAEFIHLTRPSFVSVSHSFDVVMCWWWSVYFCSLSYLHSSILHVLNCFELVCEGGEGSLGLVLSLTDHKASQSLRSWCKVTWNAGNTNDYKVGHEGKLDVMMIEGASGGCYYPEHLAPLGHVTSLPPSGNHVHIARGTWLHSWPAYLRQVIMFTLPGAPASTRSRDQLTSVR